MNRNVLRHWIKFLLHTYDIKFLYQKYFVYKIFIAWYNRYKYDIRSNILYVLLEKDALKVPDFSCV